MKKFLVLLGVVFLFGCGGGDNTQEESSLEKNGNLSVKIIPRIPTIITSITISPSTIATVGTITTINAVVKQPNGLITVRPNLTWTLADPTLATIDSKGTLTPLKAGYTKVTASLGSISATGVISIRGSLAIPTRSNYSGINLNGISYWSSQFPFVDLMKNGMVWLPINDGSAWGQGPAFPSVDANGYPTSLVSGQRAFSAVGLGGTHFQLGQYVILWDGDGTISFPLTSGKATQTSAHRATLDMTDNTGSMWVSIDKTNPANPVRNVRFLSPGTEFTYKVSQFNPEFLKKITPFSMLRFMDWDQPMALL